MRKTQIREVDIESCDTCVWIVKEKDSLHGYFFFCAYYPQWSQIADPERHFCSKHSEIGVKK